MKTLLMVVVVAALALPATAASPPKVQIAKLKRQVAALTAKVQRLETENRQLRAIAAAIAAAERREARLRARVAEHRCRLGAEHQAGAVR